MMATRNQARLTSSRAEEVEYFLFIEGLSPQCRWQELKDVLRKIPPHGYIRQAKTGGMGEITILHEKKAFDSYNHLLRNGWRGEPLKVVLSTIDQNDPRNLRTLRGPETSLVAATQRHNSVTYLNPTGNSAMVSSPLSTMGVYTDGNSSNYSNLHYPTTTSTCPPIPLMTQPAVTSQPPAVSGHDSFGHSSAFGRQCFIQQPPSSHAAQSRPRVSAPRLIKKPSSPQAASGNFSDNPMENEGRSVYLCDLPCTISEQAIREYLAPVGVVERCLVKEDRRRPPKNRSTAVATFRTSQQAQAAVESLNGHSWKGSEVKIRLDRGSSKPAPPDVKMGKGKAPVPSVANADRRNAREGPLVVNGSWPSMVSRHSRVDSDDESSCDEGE